MNSQSKFNPFSSPCLSTSASSSKIIQVCNPNYLNDGIIPGFSRGDVTLTPDNKKFITYGLGGSIKVWNSETGELLHTLKGNSYHLKVENVAISADSQTLVIAGDDNTINVWNLASGQLLRTLNGHSDSVSSVAISADGKTVVSGSSDYTIKRSD